MIALREKLLQAVAQMELRSRRHIASLLVGEYRSPFRGSGMQFKEFRRYEPGDDIRHMSWTVTARTGHPTLKIYEEERELNVIVLVDVSGSSTFGTGQRKMDMYAEICALIGLAAVQTGDPFGLLLFSDKVEAYLPPRRQANHVRSGMLRLLEQPLAGKKSDLRPALSYLRHVVKVRSLVLVLSDFQVPPFQGELRALAGRHELIFLHGYDDAERGHGWDGVHPIWDPERGEFFLLQGNSAKTQALLAQSQSQLVHSLKERGRACGADYVPLSVEDDYLQRLVRFFRSRGRSR